MFHYVYKLNDPNTGEFYYGSRSCECLPSEDNYKGSMCKWKPNKDLLIKDIIKEDFATRQDAYIFERELIIAHTSNPLNRNYNKPSINGKMGGLPGNKNSFFGKTHTQITKDKWKMNRADVSGEKNPMWGKTFSLESRQKMRESKLGLYDGSKNPRARQVYQYDLSGSLLKIWDCAIDCINYYKNEGISLSRGNISASSKHNAENTNQLKRLNKFVFGFGEINIERFKRFTQTHES